MLNKMYKCASIPIMTLLKTHMTRYRHGLFLRFFSGRNYLLFLLLCFTVFSNSLFAQMTVEDKDSNILIEVTDEGTVGAIVLPDSSVAPLITINKLYNLGGTLNWNGSPLALGGSSNWTVSGNNMYSNVSGNVGIGTVTPQFNLHIFATNPTFKIPTKLGISNFVAGSDPNSVGNNWLNISVLPAYSSIIRKLGTELYFKTDTTVQMMLTGSGQLGIGTIYPYQKLDVVSSNDTKDAAARFMNDNGTLLDIGVSGSNSGSGAGNDNPYLYTNNKDLIILTGNGSVGVGTANPKAHLEVIGGGHDDFGNEQEAIYGESHGTGTAIKAHNTSIGALFEGRSSDNTYVFGVSNDGVTTTRILEITGGSDLAEPFDFANTEEAITPGTVVAIDSQNPGQLRISDKAYDRTVAGIVSGANGINPGMIMSQKGIISDSSFLVALTGRVYVRTDASNGSIKPGDLLTTSDTYGHAMKVTNYDRAQGAIIGKAMTSLENGRGLVLVLVSLQ